MAARAKARPTVLVPLRHRQSFLDQYIPGDGHGGLVVPGALRYRPGETLDLELNFLQEQRTFRLRGLVRWRDEPGGPPGQFPGMGVEFLESERDTRDLVLDFAHGKDIAFTERSDHRFPVSLQIAYRSDSAFITDWTDDVSQGGAFIVTDRLVPLGTIMPLKVDVPGALLPLRLRGVVCWTRRAQPAGMGVKFLFESERQKKKMAALVAQLKSEIIQQVKDRIRSRPPEA
ncbi:MAG: TIGR02266 family protein [Deltaproteobacteria bacterium]|nr:TIGR02266 family protein [Deltaproteobacteria bacterium]